MKIRRNDACPCGSGKKYKKCHWGKEDAVVPKPAAPSPPESDLDDLDPAQANVMSPEYWEKMFKRLPPSMRKDFGPMIAQVKQHAEIVSQWERIDAAIQTLEAHRAEYVKLTKDMSACFRQAEKLFAEAPFADMRFCAADVDRAFQAVGYPPLGRLDKGFTEVVDRAIRFLLDDAQRKALAQRLFLTLPDYVTAGRYLDGWIIQHSASLTEDLPEGVVGPFLLAMFLHGMREWEDQREQEQEAMFKEIGISSEDIRRMGYKGTDAWLRELRNQPEKAALVEAFLAKHPELQAMSQSQCHAADEAAQRLLQRKDARVLFLSPEEVGPWIDVLKRRLREEPEGLVALTQSQPPNETTVKKFGKLIYDIASAMAKAVFTPARFDQLKSHLHELGRRFSAENDQDGLAGVHGALIAMSWEIAPEDSYFLATVCWMSLRTTISAGAPASRDGRP
ncbi:MAG: SEC-C domain-containing protein [Verrucomicrobia bacterium]|nr:SEC-C domain-containing protein [Verrucomicrobiota bacterium]